MDCRVCTADADLLLKLIGEGQLVGKIGGFSLESELDLAVLVSDFLENDSSGPNSRCSSDSESGFSDLAHLSEKIMLYKYSRDQQESKLLSKVHSLIMSINKTELHCVNLGSCNGGCIRFSLVKLLRLSGYDAAVCSSKWQKRGKIPGGDHEYVDVVIRRDSGICERLIIDIDFRSHFEIARPVESYARMLNSLPVIYVGSLTKLKQYLQVMVEAAKCSLKQNSMPLPPWRSVQYLQAKWYSPYGRKLNPDEETTQDSSSSDQKQCIGHLRRLKSSLQTEIEAERLLKPINSNNRRQSQEKHRLSTLMAL